MRAYSIVFAGGMELRMTALNVQNVLAFVRRAHHDREVIEVRLVQPSQSAIERATKFWEDQDQLRRLQQANHNIKIKWSEMWRTEFPVLDGHVERYA